MTFVDASLRLFMESKTWGVEELKGDDGLPPDKVLEASLWLATKAPEQRQFILTGTKTHVAGVILLGLQQGKVTGQLSCLLCHFLCSCHEHAYTLSALCR